MKSARLTKSLFMGASLACAAALTMTAWSSHESVEAASAALIRGQADVLVEALRLEMRRQRGTKPDDAAMAKVLAARAEDGLTFIGLYEPDGVPFAKAGEPIRPIPALLRAARPGRTVLEIDGRVRLIDDERAPNVGPGGRPGFAGRPGRPGPGGRDGEMRGPGSVDGRRIGGPRGPGRRRGGAAFDDRAHGGGDGPEAPPMFPPGPPGSGERRVGGVPRPLMVMEFEPRELASMRGDADRGLAFGIGGAVLLVLTAWFSLSLLGRAARAEKRLIEKRELERLGEMSAVLAHEMRNPIAGIKGHLQLLAERFRDNPTARDKVERVLEDSVRLEGLTESLLDFVRSGGVHKVPTDPVELLDRATHGLPPDAVRLDVTEAPVSWSLDLPRLERALSNLLRNAHHASPAPGSVNASATVEGGRLILQVRDHGPGIESSLLPRLFEPFVTTKTRGTGLGLAVTRRIVEAHGGTIAASNVSADEGGGACFRISLPPT